MHRPKKGGFTDFAMDTTCQKGHSNNQHLLMSKIVTIFDINITITVEPRQLNLWRKTKNSSC